MRFVANKFGPKVCELEEKDECCPNDKCKESFLVEMELYVEECCDETLNAYPKKLNDHQRSNVVHKR